VQQKLHETGLPDATTVIQLLIVPAFAEAEKNRRRSAVRPHTPVKVLIGSHCGE
jgi:hypothetical protein